MNFELHVIDNQQEVLKALADKIPRALEAAGYAAEANVKILTPVDTGRLRGSIGHYVDDRAVTIGTNVEYAVYVEFDDNKRHPNGQAHFLRDGIANNIKEYESLIRNYLLNM